MHLQHETVTLASPLGDTLEEARPVHDATGPVFVALTTAGDLLRLDLDDRRATKLARVPADLDLPSVCLQVSAGGELATLVELMGSRGAVVDLQTGHPLARLAREGGTELGISGFFTATPFRHGGLLLLLHSTAGDRLEVSDARSGACVTAIAQRAAGEVGGVAVSPGARRIAANWSTAADATVVTWELDPWLRGETPPTRALPQPGEVGSELCWLDDRVLSVYSWPPGADEAEVLSWDTVSDRIIGRLRGPAPGRAFDGLLYSFSGGRGAGGSSVWDLATGARVAADDDGWHRGYHRGARLLYAFDADGTFRLSRLVP